MTEVPENGETESKQGYLFRVLNTQPVVPA